MPLHKIEEINSTRYIAIWHISESLQELHSMLHLSDHDNDLLRSYRSEKKKFEWLAGRVCVKALCQTMGIHYTGLTKNDNGKPFLLESTAEVSMTHSFPYVAAIIDSLEDVGIDLEQPKETLRKVAHKFLSEQELADANNNLQSLCIYWCAKETLYKICDKHLIFREQMSIDKFTPDHKGILTGKVIADNTVKDYKLEFRIEKDYILTFNL